MTIRDLLSLNSAWFNDYITIRNDDITILKNLPNSELHPKWLDYEVKNYFLLPHKDDEESYSVVNCDYIITIYETKVFQDKTTCIDVVLNERIKENESTNND